MFISSTEDMTNIVDGVKRTVRRHPILYFPLKFLLGESKSARKICSRSSHICIEGYPSSGNSFFVNLVLGACQERIDVCSHCHAVANIRRALDLELPTFVLLRDPVEAIASRCARFDVAPTVATDDYHSFYEWVLENHGADPMWVISFESLTERPDLVLKVMSKHTEFDYRKDTEMVVEETKVFIRLWQERYGTDDSISLPNSGRNERKQQIRQEIKELVRARGAVEVWEKLNEVRRI